MVFYSSKPMNKPLSILITTGIYPPRIGGPAQYAKNLKEALVKEGHKVYVYTYGLERFLPTGFRHLFFFFKIIPRVLISDFCITLDTFSVGLPSLIVCRLFQKKIIVRIGGDFLWENYLLSTKKQIPLPVFYENLPRLSFKEKIIFKAHQFILNKADLIVFSTEWQRSIWQKKYKISDNTKIIENCFYEKIPSQNPTDKNFIMVGRKTPLKNTKVFEQSFSNILKKVPDLTLDTQEASHKELLEKIKNSYAVAIPSISEVSPNLALESLRYNKPFILTKHTGFYDKLKNVAVFIDPLDQKDIEEKILLLSDPSFYEKQVKQLEDFNFRHSYREIAEEFLEAFEETKNS